MDYFNWNKVNEIKVLNKIILDEFIPKENITQTEIVIGRDEVYEIEKKKWPQIKDPDVSSDRAKQAFVSSYFSTCVFLLKRIENLPISANQSYEKTVTLRHVSSIRTTITTSFRIENVIEANLSYADQSLRNTLSVSYGIEKMEEYSSESSKETVETVRFDPMDKDRNVVFWDLAKVVAVYRRDFRNNVKLVGFGDYYVESRKTTY